MNWPEGTLKSQVYIAADHPAFEGHFPGVPVLPGVVLAALVQEALHGLPQLAQRVGSWPQIDELKFLAPVGPRTELCIGLWPQGSGVGFEVRRDATPVARGRLSAGEA